MRRKFLGTSDRPRLYVFKSNKHIYAQIIDDIKHKILCSSSSISANLRFRSSVNRQIAYSVGQEIAYKALKQGISKIIFDRGDHIYHGQIKSLAEGVRKEGISF